MINSAQILYELCPKFKFNNILEHGMLNIIDQIYILMHFNTFKLLKNQKYANLSYKKLWQIFLVLTKTIHI
jgi:hypothetical protein